MRIFLIQGFQLFDSLIDIVLTFGFGHDIAILKMAIFNKVDYIDLEPALMYIDICYWPTHQYNYHSFYNN